MRLALANYQDLLCFSVKEALENIYPYTVSFFKQDLVNVADYFRRTNPNQTFQMNQAVKAFPAFLEKTDFKLIKRLVDENKFLSELARYEWLEVEAQNARDFTFPENFHQVAPLIPEAFEPLKPFCNPTLVKFISKYPITKIIKDLSDLLNEPLDKQSAKFNEVAKKYIESKNNTECNVVIYRDQETFKVRFIELTEIAMELIALSLDHPTFSYKDLLDNINQKHQMKISENNATDLFRLLFEKKLLLGSLS